MIRKLFHILFLLKRPITLGVRVFATNETGDVLMVRHGYVEGWYLPGGGVEIGETASEAAIKELHEETGYEAIGPMTLMGAYYNKAATRRDHVLLYRCAGIAKVREFESNWEIAEIGFFDPNALPEETTNSTRARIAEILEGQSQSEYW